MSRDSERWASVPDQHDYLISDEGSVRRLLPNGTWRQLTPYWNRPPHWTNREPYLRVRLGRRQAYVHLLVLEAFVGPRPGDAEGDHIDHDRANNSLPNLRWRDASENAADRRGSAAYSSAWDDDGQVSA